MRKILKSLLIILVGMVVAIGCKNTSEPKPISLSKDVKKTIEEEMNKEKEKKEKADAQENNAINKENNEVDKEENKDSSAENSTDDKKEFDYDLTEMNADMIYATIYMVVSDPESYNGKKFRIYGNCYNFPTTDGKSMSHYCLIKDAMACCAQGLEFILKDTPDKFPADDTPIVVEGELESYTLPDIPTPLCRLVNAKLKIGEK